MAYPSQAVANEFLELARKDGQQLTPMQIQKLVYLRMGVSGNCRRKADRRTRGSLAVGPGSPVSVQRIQALWKRPHYGTRKTICVGGIEGNNHTLSSQQRRSTQGCISSANSRTDLEALRAFFSE